jgi:hypothetical protein
MTCVKCAIVRGIRFGPTIQAKSIELTFWGALEVRAVSARPSAPSLSSFAMAKTEVEN